MVRRGLSDPLAFQTLGGAMSLQPPPSSIPSHPETPVSNPPSSKRKRRSLILRSIAIASLLVVACYLAIATLSAHILTSPRNRPIDLEASWIASNYQPWAVRAEDGVTLRGWFYPSNPGQEPLLVLVHGLGDNRQNVAGQAKRLVALGYNVLVFDLRGHGESDPERVSMGLRERRDLRAVLLWASKRGFEPDRIGWVGYSLGGATLLMEAAENPEIQTVVVDSAFGDLPAILETQLSVESGLPSVFNPGILFVAEWLFGASVNDLVPARSVRNWDGRPLLLIHGDADNLVPKSQAQTIARSAGAACEAVYLPGVGHCQAFRKAPDAYIERLDQFFREHLAH